MENICAVPQVVIRHAPHVLSGFPFGVDAVHLVEIDDLIDADIVHRCIFDGDVTAVGDGDGVSFHIAVLRLDTRDTHGRHGGRVMDTGGRESAVAIRVAEENGAVRRTQGFCLREIGIMLAIQGVVVVQKARL